MATIRRTFARSAGSIINLKPNTDYKSYTSVQASTYKTMSNDMKKVGKDLGWVVKSYAANKKQKSTYK
ncbi:hypothetical protein PT273_06240 [Orbaceae bacterium ESL0727]|nr:hypothetical protein [Orbaceae bacterium ESL0727]